MSKKRDYNLSEETKRVSESWRQFFLIPFYVAGFAVILFGYDYLNENFGVPYYGLAIILVLVIIILIRKDNRKNKSKDEL